MNAHRTLFLVFLMACATVLSVAQGPVLVPVQVEGLDTVPVFMLSDHTVSGVMSAKARRKQEKNDKLTRNVVKVYPYARVTAKLLAEYEHDLSLIEKEHDKDLYVKLAEAELRAEFEEELKNLTVSQGRVLIKLIDRETGHTSYDLVKELRGGFQAWVWQGVARLFGNDLKDDYDPEGDDALVESVVHRIENGELATAPRAARTEKAQARLEKRKARLFRKYGMAYVPPSPD
jgi:hypothetical protein